jgi:hypothetical protein
MPLSGVQGLGARGARLDAAAALRHRSRQSERQRHERAGLQRQLARFQRDLGG